MGQLSCSCSSGNAPAVGFQPARSYSRTVPLADGDAGTAQTIALIRRAVAAGVVSPEVRETAAGILQTVPRFDDLAEVRAVYEWVLENIRYTRDPVNGEMVSDAAWTLRHKIGDCDDINGVLLPALLMAVGVPVRVVTIANDGGDPEAFAHIYAEAQVHGKWIPLDAAREGAAFGVAPRRAYRKRIWSLTENSFQDVRPASAGGGGLAGHMIGQDYSAPWYTNLSDWITSAGNVITPFFQPSPEYGPTYGPSYPTAPAPAPAPAPAGGIDTSTLLIIGAVGLGAVLLLSRK